MARKASSRKKNTATSTTRRTARPGATQAGNLNQNHSPYARSQRKFSRSVTAQSLRDLSAPRTPFDEAMSEDDEMSSLSSLPSTDNLWDGDSTRPKTISAIQTEDCETALSVPSNSGPGEFRNGEATGLINTISVYMNTTPKPGLNLEHEMSKSNESAWPAANEATASTTSSAFDGNVDSGDAMHTAVHMQKDEAYFDGENERSEANA